MLVFSFLGFFAGYLYGDKSCYENPLVYGIKQLNEKFIQCSADLQDIFFGRDIARFLKEEMLKEDNENFL